MLFYQEHIHRGHSLLFGGERDNMQNGKIGLSNTARRKRSLLSGVMLLTVANIIVKILGFFYKVPLNAVLGDEMANVNAAYAIYALLYTVSTAGIPNAVSLSVSRSRALGNTERAERIFRVTVTSLLLGGLFLSVLLIALARPISYFNSGGDSYLCLLAIAPALTFAAANSVLRGFFQGFERMEPTAVSELFEAFGKTGFGLLFAFAALYLGALGEARAAAFAVFAITVGVGMSAGYLALKYVREKPKLFTHSFRLRTDESDRLVLGAVMKIALPITLAAAMMSFSTLLDAQLMRPLLERYYGDAAMAKALYSDYSTGALTLYNLPTVLVTPLTAAMIPYIAAALERGDRIRAEHAMESALRAAAIVSLPCALGMSALASPILAFVFRGDRDMAENAGPLLSVLAAAVFFAAVFSVSGAVLQSAKEERKPIRSLVLGLAVKVVSMLTLTRLIGEAGVPWSTVLFFLTVSLSNLFYVRKTVGLRIRLGRTFFRPAIAALASAFCAWLAYFFLFPHLGNGFSLVLAIGAAIGVYTSLVFLLRCVGREELALLPGMNKLSRFSEMSENGNKCNKMEKKS